MQAPYPERRNFGNATIEVQDDEFFNGFQVGNFYFRAHKQQAELLSDAALYGFLCDVLQGVRETDRYRAGAISGWYAALYGYRLDSRTSTFSVHKPASEERG